MSQLEVLAEQIDEKGVRKLSRTGNFEKLIRSLLSDKQSALNIVANDSESPICPNVWNGMDIVDTEGIQISGYYYEDNKYYTKITCNNDLSKEFIIELGNKLPTNVAIEVKKTTACDMFGEQIGLYLKLLASPPVIADGIYNFAVMNGIPPFLPDNLSPSDLPILGELLDDIDPWDHTAHLTRNTISLSIVTFYPNCDITDLDIIKFKTYEAN